MSAGCPCERVANECEDSVVFEVPLQIVLWNIIHVLKARGGLLALTVSKKIHHRGTCMDMDRNRQ